MAILKSKLYQILTTMKKYSSYANLKIAPSPLVSKGLAYQYWPTKLTSTPSTRKGVDIPLMMISKQPYAMPITTPANSKYSAGYLQKQKLFSSKKENKDVNNLHHNGQGASNAPFTKINATYANQGNKIVILNKPHGSKSKKVEEKERSQKKQKSFKHPQLDNKQNLIVDARPVTRYDVQSPKGLSTRPKEEKQRSKPKTQFCEKQKSQLTIKPVQVSETKQKQKKQKQNDKLQQYVTKYEPEQKSLLLHCTSQSNLIKAINLQQKKPLKGYYRSALYNAFFSTKPSSFNQICKNHLTTSIQFLSYARKNKGMIPSSHSVNKIALPPTNRKTLVFDLDETLIHCNQSLDIPHDVALEITFPNNSKIKAGINVRPFAVECLRELSKHFQIIVFTASHECYANVIVDYLDPTKQLISHRFFRETCHKTEQGFYVKDLRVFSHSRDLSNLLLIDNAAYSYCFQPENGVPIVPFYNNKADMELKQIVPYLREFLDCKSMRNRNEGYMRLSEYHRYSCGKQLVNQLYY